MADVFARFSTTAEPTSPLAELPAWLQSLDEKGTAVHDERILLVHAFAGMLKEPLTRFRGAQ